MAKSLTSLKVVGVTVTLEPVWVVDVGNGRHCSYEWKAGSHALQGSIMTWLGAEKCHGGLGHMLPSM
jgi:hypothetical protein